MTRSTLVGIAIVTLASALTATTADEANAQTYIYSDDFSFAYKVLIDSYDSSPFTETPGPSPDGVLLLEASGDGFEGAVKFQTGTDQQSADRYPHLTYRLPVQRSLQFSGIDGTIVDVTAHVPAGGSISFYSSANGSDWTLVSEIQDAGTGWYAVELSGRPDHAEFIRMVGDNATLDRLQFNVFCTGLVGDEQTTFGAVKTSYR